MPRLEFVHSLSRRVLEEKILRLENGKPGKFSPHTMSFVGRATTEAKKKIQREILQAGLKSLDTDPLETEERTDVYQLALQLFPLTKISND